MVAFGVLSSAGFIVDVDSWGGALGANEYWVFSDVLGTVGFTGHVEGLGGALGADEDWDATGILGGAGFIVDVDCFVGTEGSMVTPGGRLYSSSFPVLML